MNLAFKTLGAIMLVVRQELLPPTHSFAKSVTCHPVHVMRQFVNGGSFGGMVLDIGQ